MSTQTWLHFFLALHLFALTVAVGVTIANAVATREFWKLYDNNREHAISAFKGIRKFRILGMLGLLLLIASGITMLWLYNWAYGEQLWFKIKMTCILLILANGFTLGRVTTMKLEKLLKGETPSYQSRDISPLRRNLSIFYCSQLSLFLIIIVLASFRFV